MRELWAHFRRYPRGGNMRNHFLMTFSLLLLGASAHAVEYHLWASWGATGVEAGQFREPMGIAVDRDGFVYIADSRNKRVQKLGPEGKPVLEFGSAGDGPGQFEKPVDVAIAPDGTVYVGDYDLDRVQAFSPKGEFLFGWGETGNGKGQFRAAAGLAIDSAGNVYVADFYNNRIQKFNGKGDWILALGKKGHGKGELNYPTDLSFDREGNLIVADAYNHRLSRFTSDGRPLGTWGHRWKRFLRLSSALHVPSGIAVDSNGGIFVADSANKRIAFFDRSGSLEGEWTLPGSADSKVYSPTRVAVTADGQVLAADTANDRILVLKAGPPPGGAPKKLLAVASTPVRADVLVGIKGMSCPFCAYGIEKHLKALKNVSDVSVNLGESTAAVTLVPEKKLSDEEIRGAVEKAGFKVSEIKSIGQ